MKITIRTPIEKTELFECAAWHRTYRSETGVFDAELVFDQHKAAYNLVAVLPATIVSCCLISRLGSHYGNDPGKDEVGQQSTFMKVWPALSVFGDGYRIDPDWSDFSNSDLRQLKSLWAKQLSNDLAMVAEFYAKGQLDMVAFVAGNVKLLARAIDNTDNQRQSMAAFKSGQRAKAKGLHLDQNPYDDYVQRCRWHDGWNSHATQSA